MLSLQAKRSNLVPPDPGSARLLRRFASRNDTGTRANASSSGAGGNPGGAREKRREIVAKADDPPFRLHPIARLGSGRRGGLRKQRHGGFGAGAPRLGPAWLGLARRGRCPALAARSRRR